MNQAFIKYFRCPAEYAHFDLLSDPSGSAGYFKFGPEAICYGQVSVGFVADEVTRELHDAVADVRLQRGKCLLPFDPTAVVEALRREHYLEERQPQNGFVRRSYYGIRPLLPVAVRKHLQRFSLRGWENKEFPQWPVDRSVDKLHERLMILQLQAHGVQEIPFIWFWPEGKSACAIMTHDVETKEGLDFCPSLMDLNDSFGIKSSFQLIPGARYKTSQHALDLIRDRGFEVNVHDWNHDGRLFSDRTTFLQRVPLINDAAKRFGAEGFRAAVMYRNTEWFDSLAFSYDLSVPNVAHLDPQPGGCCTVMPYFIGQILELPLTTTQDYPLFHILSDYSISHWKRQIQLILESHGLVSSIVHPDYIIEKKPRAIYSELLEFLTKLLCEQNVWLALPREVNRWWRQRSQMKLVRKDGHWEIEGPGAERARIAYARSDGNNLAYRIE